MGFLDTIISTTVFKYKADASQAIAEAKKLSGEQKKAAQDQAKGLEEQGKSAEGLAAKYAKGAAVIAAAYVVAKQGLADFKKESALAVGAAGVNIKALDDAAGGLKTRWELMTIAQAGSQGAWKLSTQQIGFVIEGMRALEKKGYDGIEVQNALTESLRKGKLEGLDKFGLSTKDLGSSTENLKSLMKQLAKATDDVGHNFDKAGDAAVRAGVKFENARDRASSSVGKGIDYLIQDTERRAGAAGRLARGDVGGAIDVFMGRGEGGALSDAAVARVFEERRNMQREAARRVAEDQVGAISLVTKWAVGAKAQIEIENKAAQEVLDMYDKGVEDRKRAAGAGNRALGEFIPGVTSEGFDASIPRGRRFETFNPAADRRIQLQREAADFNRAMQDLADVDRQIKYADAQAAKGAKQDYLDSIFGPVERFDAYAEGFRTLTEAVRASGDAILDSVIKGEKITKATAGRAVAAVLGAESHKLWGLGLSTELQGIATLNPAMMAAGAGEMAGAFVLGRIAAQFGGSGKTSGGRASGSTGGARPMLPMTAGNSSITIVMGDSNAGDGPRQRGRTTRAAIQLAGQVAPPQGVHNG